MTHPPACHDPPPRRVVPCLAAAQLICWSTFYYPIGALAGPIARDLGWSSAWIMGGLTTALVTMAMVSGLAGSLLARRGSRPSMSMGVCLGAAGCIVMAVSRSILIYYAGWVVVGVGMRLSLYDAAFAALFRLAGADARRGMSQITLVAGLASTVSLPATHLLARLLGWRGALLTLAGCALLALAPLLLLPDDRDVRSDFSHSPGRFQRGPRSADSRTVLCALTVFLSNALAVGLVTHLLRILTSLGWPTPSAVRIAALAGVAQCAARLCDVISGGAAGPFRLNRLAGALMSAGLGMALVFSQSLAAVIGFVALLGASGGITTIVRGALPILLFPGEQGAASVAWITASACLATAVAPPLYGLLVDRGGPAGVLVVSLALALVSLAFSLVLEAIHADHANRTSPSASARTGSPSRGL